MKTNNKILIRTTSAAIIASALCAVLSGHSLQSASSRQPSHDVIVMQGFQSQAYDSNHVYYNGLMLLYSSSSSNAPVFPQPVFVGSNNILSNTIPLAQAIADALDAGFHIEHCGESLQFLFVRNNN